MKTEELVSSFKEIIDAYHEMNNPESPLSREIRSWRLQFLEEKCKFDDKVKELYIKEVFMALPCETIMKFPFEKQIELLSNSYDTIK